MEEKQNMICVSCPLGCGLTVTCEGDKVTNVEGNSCPRGKSYAETEVRDPRRVFASTVRVKGGKLPVCPVRSKTPAPKARLHDIAVELAKAEVTAPVKIGQVILPRVCGTDVDIVATRDLDAK